MSEETVVEEIKPKAEVVVPPRQQSIEVESWKPVPKTFEEQQRLAKMYLDSKVLPARFDSVAMIVTALHFASEHFPGREMTALRQIAVIEGSPCLFGDLPLALVQRSGLLEGMSERFDGEGDDLKATAIIKRKGLESIERSFSVKDARTAGLWGKVSRSGHPSPWVKYPKRMLQMRARSWALKDGFADVLTGIAIGEYDFNTTGDELVDVTPAKNRLEKLNSDPGISTPGPNGPKGAA